MRIKDGCGQRKESNQLDLAKGLTGRGLMVSDFADEFNGLLRLTEKEFERGKLIYPDIKKN